MVVVVVAVVVEAVVVCLKRKQAPSNCLERKVGLRLEMRI